MRIWIAIVLVGCGGSNETPDAAIDGPVDAAPDAPADTLACTPRAGNDPVTVDGPSGSPMLTVKYVIHDATGAVVTESTAMSADTTVQLAVPSCGMVSVSEVDTTNTRHPLQLLTWTGVQPGDHLIHPRRAPSEVDQAVTLQVPALTGATDYTVNLGCQTGASIGSTTMSGPDNETIPCRTGVTGFSAVVTATTSSGPNISFAPNLAFAGTGTTNVTLPAYQPATTTTVAASGLSKFNGGRAIVATFARPAPDRGVVVAFSTGTIANGTNTFVPVLVAPGNGILDLLVESDPMQTRFTRLLRGMASIPSSVALGASDLLPVPSGSVDAATTRPTVTWGADGAFDADAIVLGVKVGPVEWTLIGPARPGSARFPDEPSDILAAATPTLTLLSLVDATSSYDAVRGQERELFYMVHPPDPGSQFRNSEWHN